MKKGKWGTVKYKRYSLRRKWSTRNCNVEAKAWTGREDERHDPEWSERKGALRASPSLAKLANCRTEMLIEFPAPKLQLQGKSLFNKSKIMQTQFMEMSMLHPK